MQDTETITLAAFIAKHNLTMKLARADSNPNMPDRSMFHYRVTIRSADGDRMTVPFSVGSGWNREPNLADVLSCLASDAGTWQNARSFEDFCSELGYDTDSRNAERIYKAIEKQSSKLSNLLGEDAYQELLYHPEGL